jgi:filamentous hemagglutinin family protein
MLAIKDLQMTICPRSACATLFKLTPLWAAIAGQLLLPLGANAAPAGGTVVGGSGMIEQSGLNTTVTQDTDRLAIDWASFNVAADERVAFVQPNESSVALNRILDMSGSQILGRIDANGQVILMNPNGVFFGAGATVDVGGLIATGLAIDTSDFMNGDLLLQAVDGTAGTVINRGLINAAIGGNVALIGKQVTNSGLISAHLGHVALASGRQAVVTFDDQGLLGVRVDEASLQAELGMGPGVTNSGTITAAGGKILLTGSVSEDLFARVVNAGDLSGDTEAVVHEDGSFTIGAGVDVLNTGTLSATSDIGAAGDVVMVGRNVNQRGLIEADQIGGGDAGGIHLEASNTVRLTHGASLSAMGATGSGDVVMAGDNVIGHSDTLIRTSGDTSLTAYLQLKTPTLSTQDLTIKSVGTVRQTGAIKSTGTAHLVLTAGADVRLSEADNDFTRITMDTGHTSFVSLQDANDLELGILDLLDSTVRLSADGTIRQMDDSAALLDGSDLHLAAAGIELGSQAAGGGVTLYDGWLNLQFSESIKALEAVRAPGSFNNSLMTAKGYNGVDLLLARSQGEFGLAATLEDFSGISIAGLTADTAAFTSLGEIQQTGAIHLSGAFNLNMGAGGSALLNHQDNDFRSVAFDLGHTSVVELTDANDLLIGNLNVTDSSVTLTSLGTNAMISQMAMTAIDLYDSTLAVSAARVYLGDKATTGLRLHGFSDLRVDYERGARIFGTSSSPAELPEFVPFLTRGNSEATSLDVQGHGDFALNVSTNDLQFNIHQVHATDAQLSSISQVRQTGAIQLSGELHLNLAAEADVQLNHSGNTVGKVSATTAYTSNVSLYDMDGLTLGELDLADSNVLIRTGGDIHQESGSAITLSDTGLTLDGASVSLHSLADGGGARLFNSLLTINFRDAIDVVGALQTGGEFDFSTIEINGMNTDDAANELLLSQNTPLDVRANLNAENGDLSIDLLDAENAELFTLNQIVQTGKMTVTGELFLRTPVGGQVVLNNPENNFNLITIESDHVTAISLIDANDLLLGNWDMRDTSVTVRSVGENARVSQAENTRISGNESDLTIYAANIEFGAQGTSSVTLNNLGMLSSYFTDSLLLNGQIQLHSTSAYFRAEGSDDDNRLTIGQYADVDLDAIFEEYLIDLKGGNDIIELHRDFNYGFFTGVGRDQIYLVNNEVNYTAEDFDPAEDEILLLP